MMDKKAPFILFLFVLLLINPVSAETINYEYDGLHRLTQVERSDGTVIVYNYDTIGNRTSKVVTVSGPTTEAQFTSDLTNGFAPLQVAFTDQSIGNITSWLWVFGDGETSTDQNPAHTYEDPGNYTVSLTVDGPDGSDTLSRSQYINVETPSGPILAVVPPTSNVSAESDATTFDVSNIGSGIMNWTASANDGWLTILSGGSGTDSGTVIVNYAENTGSARTGSITITSPDASNSPQTVQVIQAAGEDPAVEVLTPTASEVWSLGSTYDIEWTASSPNGISEIRIYYHYSGNVTNIATLATNPGVYSWTVPSSAGYLSENARIRVVAVDGNTNSSEDYSEYFSVQDSAAPPHPWDAPDRLTDAIDMGLYVSEDNTNSALAVDNAGDVHLIYRYVEDEFVPSTPRVYTQKIFYRKKMAGSWQTPEEIYSVTYESDDNNMPGYWFSNFRIAIDSNNYPHISWVYAGPRTDDCTSFNGYEIYYLGYNGTAWESPVNVSENNTRSWISDIAVDSSDNVHFIWQDGITYLSGGCSATGNAALFHRFKYSDGTWSTVSAVIDVTYYGNYPSLAKGLNGYLHLAFTAQDALEYLVWDGTTWSAPSVISNQGDDYYRKAIEVDSNDNLLLVYDVWGDFGGGGVHQIRYTGFDGNSWSMPEIVSIGNNGYEKIPTLAVNSLGFPQVVWYEDSPSVAHIYYKQKSPYGWSSTVRLSTAATIPQITGANTLSADISGDDILHVSWQAYYNGGDEVYYTYADVTDDQTGPDVTITSPSDGDSLAGGTVVPIIWEAVDNTSVADIQLEYTTDGGSTFTTIAASTTNTGSYGWTVPDIDSNNVQIYVTATDIADNQSVAVGGIFTITPAPPDVQAQFTADVISGIAPLVVSFTDQSTGNITSWLWVFGDGSTSADPDPIHTYETPGTYTVSLTVNGPNGSDTETKTDFITVDQPTLAAEFHASTTSGVAPLEVAFSDDSTGTVSSWSWDFGDGNTSDVQIPVHTYDTPGTYTVSLTVTGPGGSHTETKTNYITVAHPLPVAGFTATATNGIAPFDVTFTDESTGTITTWNWEFGDGNSSAVQSPSHTYDASGNYSVSLTVTGPGGSHTETKSNYIVVQNSQTPEANFAVSPRNGLAPLAVIFIDQSTGTIESRLWDFGDGQTSDEDAPIHIYNSPGVYTVQLTVTGPGGSDIEPKTDWITVDADTDGDGVVDRLDLDDDNDSIADEFDAFPSDPNEWLDTDGDGIGDNADPDDDNDGLNDSSDNCPKIQNPGQDDADGDNIGDACEDIPYIYTINPNPAALGSQVTIEGINFGSDQGSGMVTFYRDIPATTISTWSDTQITCTIPFNAKHGCVKVITDSGESSCGQLTISNFIEYPETGSVAFINASGNEVETYASGEDVHIRVTDGDVNANPGQQETLSVLVTSFTEDTGTPASNTAPVADGGNTGNGVITDIKVGDETKSEDWQVTCVSVELNTYVGDPIWGNVDIYTFEVIGSASGVQNRQYRYYEGFNNEPYESDGGELQFSLEQGSTPFAVGDRFTFSTTAAVIVGETVTLTETAADSGIFEGSIAVNETALPVAGNGVLEASRADLITAYYADASGDWGDPVRVKDTALYAVTIVNGTTYTADVTWSKADGPYLITGDVTVSENVTLTIEAGVKVLFLANSDDRSGGQSPYDSELIINGALNAVGTAQDPIAFTSSLQQPSKGDWGGIHFTTSWKENPVVVSLEHVTVEYSGYGIRIGSYWDITISDSVIWQNGNHGIHVTNADIGSLDVSASTISDNGSDGIFMYDCDFSAEFRGNTISNNQEIGFKYYFGSGNLIFSENTLDGNPGGGVFINWETSQLPVVDGNIISNCGDFGINIGNSEINVQPTVQGNTVSGCGYGLDISGKVRADIRDNVITANNSGISVRYTDINGDGSFSITGNVIADNSEYGIFIQEYANPTINYNDIYGNGTYAIENRTAFDINARNNWWGAEVTQLMETGDNPQDLPAIFDSYNDYNSGFVNYSGWLDGEKDTGQPVTNTEDGKLVFVNASGADVETYASGEDVHIRVTDGDVNANPGQQETLSVLVTSFTEDTGTPASNTAPVADGGNTGNGVITDIKVGDETKSEDWQVTCVSVELNTYVGDPIWGNVDIYTFEVIGSASGVQNRQYRYYEGFNNEPYESDGGELQFSLEQGSTPFAVGDRFTFSTTAAVIVGETVTLTETAADSGIFEGSIAVNETALPVAGNGVLEASRADLITAYYADASGDWGDPVRVKDTALYAVTIVNGTTYTADVTWSKADGPYLITGDVTVSENVTLTIEAGVKVLFLANSDDRSGGQSPYDSELIINGALNAVGTAQDPIAFTSSLQQPSKGDWGGIHFTTSWKENPVVVSLEHVTVEYSGYGIRIGSYWDITISDSVIWQNGNHGIHVTNADIGSLDVSASTISDNGSDGIFMYDCDFSAEFRGNTISNNQEIGFKYYFGSGNLIFSENTLDGNPGGGVFINWETSQLPVVDGNIISNCGDFGINIGNSEINVQPTVQGNTVSGCGYGLDISGKVRADIRDNVITANNSGISVRYTDINGDGSFSITGNVIADNSEYGIFIQEYANPTINYNDIYGNGTYAIENRTAFDINARNNWWGAEVTQLMETGDNPQDLPAIFDSYNDYNSGFVNYSGWLDGEKDTGQPVTNTEDGKLVFVNASGADVETYASGEDVHIRVTDGDVNANPGQQETLSVLVTSFTEDTGTPASNTAPVADGGNTGNGVITDIKVGDETKSEDWQVTCVSVELNTYVGDPIWGNVDIYTFEVIGSASGVQNRQYRYYEGFNNEPYESDGGELQFSLEQGSTPFAVGDRFTFSTTAAVIVGETVTLTETAADSGIFEGSIAVNETALPVAGNGVLEASRADLITAYYADASGDWGDPVRVKDTALYAVTIVNGTTYTADVTWSKADSPYLITGDVTVSENVTLTIEAGVKVLFLANSDDRSGGQSPYDSELIINGALNAVGTAQDPIAFTSSLQQPSKGDWGGIHFTTSWKENPVVVSLEHVTVEYSGYGIRIGSYWDITISDSVIWQNGNHGIHVTNADIGSLDVSASTISDNGSDGIFMYDCDFSAEFRGNTISNNQEIGFKYYFGSGNLIFSENTLDGNPGGGVFINWETSQLPVVDGNIISNCGDFGINIGNSEINVQPTVQGNTVSGCGYGLDISGKVRADIRDNVITANNSGISVRYTDINGDGSFSITGNVIADNSEYGIFIQEYANPTINYNDIYGNGTYAIENHTAFDINARNNWWGAEVTQQIAAGDNPKDLEAFYDIFDDSSSGLINYSAWYYGPLHDFDSDGDGVPDDWDNCPNSYNPDQADLDGDQKGDVCDDDADGDNMLNIWEIANGLDHLDAGGVNGADGDLDNDGWRNYAEYLNGTLPNDETSVPPPTIKEAIPHNNAGILDDTRMPDNSSFALLIEDEAGIDITELDSIKFTIDDGVNLVYVRNLNNGDVVKVTKLTENGDTAVTKFWAAYHRSAEATMGSFDFANVIGVTVDLKDSRGGVRVNKSFSFKIETETQHDDAIANAPATNELPIDDPDLDPLLGLDSGIEVPSGEPLAGAKIIFNSSEPVAPTLGPSDEIPPLETAGENGVGVPLNLQPPTVFSTPVKILIPCPGSEDVSGLSVYYYNGTNWVLAVDAAGNILEDGWIVPGSRVNRPFLIEIRAYHFTGVQAGGVTDSDNDGIPDRVEDANQNGAVDSGETDPDNIDTDGDGLQDGTEIGLTSADVGPDTDPNVFNPDQDPATTTDPLDNDSDDDFIPDGTEDANQNGKVDGGETDPYNRDSDGDGAGDGEEINSGSNPLNDLSYPELNSISLKTGLNLIAIPAEVKYRPDLKDWMALLGDSSQIEEVSAYDPNLGKFITLIPEDPASPSFTLNGGEGLMIYAKTEVELNFNSISCVQPDLKAGFNLVGFACPPENYSAFLMLTALGIENISSIQRFSATDATFETAAINDSGQPVGVDFPIIPGEGYFIFMKQEVADFNF